jgi:hypothetical protein
MTILSSSILIFIIWTWISFLIFDSTTSSAAAASLEAVGEAGNNDGN